MTDIKLMTLRLHNFKGIRDFTLEPNGESIDVFGDNETGKTTLMDAIQWLLFDKDSAGRKDFDIKTLVDGEPRHNLEHSVEAEFDIGEKVTLKKLYKEVWTRKRGSAQQTFTGHTSDHFVDGVPVTLKEYKERVAAIADEETFRLLTNPAHFNALKWEERRKIVLAVAGDVSDAEVIASKPDLAELSDILGNHTIEEHRKKLAAARKEVNTELEQIPVRIAEVERGLPAEPTYDGPHVDTLAKERDGIAEELARVEAGGEVAELTKRLRELEAEALAMDNADTTRLNDAKAAADKARSDRRSRVSDVRDERAEWVRERDRLIADIEETADIISSKRIRAEELRAKWIDFNSREFTGSVEEVCPTCEQALPADRVAEARDRAVADFNRLKSADIEEIERLGREIKTQADALAGENEQRREQVKTIEGHIERLDTLIVELTAEAEAPIEIEAVDVDPKRAELSAAIEKLNHEIQTMKDGVAPKVAELTSQRDALDERKKSAQAAADARSAIARGNARIEELSAEEKRLASEYERLEREQFLTEEFTRAKVDMLEDRINAKFKMVTFKMFETQINGGLKECCTTLLKGVPYDTNLNNAGRIAAGLDIITTLSGHYGVTAPIFVDNAEAITDLPDITSQVIALYVSAGDKELRTERKGS